MHPGWNVGPLLAFFAALAVGAVAPMVFIYLRHQVRLERLRVLKQFERTFGDKPKEPEIGGSGYSRSLEFTREKYTEEVSPRQKERGGLESAAWWQLRTSWHLLFSALPLILLCAIGFYSLFSCVGWRSWDELVGKDWRPILLIGGLATKTNEHLDRVITVAAFAFLGAYAFVLNALVRAVATFDLSPLTLVRLAVHVAVAVAGVVVAYRAFPDLSGVVPDIGKVNGLSPGWYLTAFIAGMTPDLIINWLIGRAQNLQGAKVQDNRILMSAKSVSPEVIDGIDYFIRFRLQQANIFEVHHLAMANPIMLFVETPYGVYQCIDWVAQAQLCTVVGPERFLALREFNIRTIFDLERAIFGRETTSQVRRLIGAIIFSTPPEVSARAWIFWDRHKELRTAGIGSAQFGDFVAELLAEAPVNVTGGAQEKDADRTLVHLVRIILDDLHVHRLRDIWISIRERLGDSLSLPDSVSVER